MSNITPHIFNTITVRSLERDGQIWFVATDVCKALEISNTPHALKRLDDDEKATIANSDSRHGQGAQNYNIINESGLYSLVLRSRKPEAKQFKKWVTSEVLPSIRKTGKYQLETKRNRRSLRKPSNTLLAVTRAIRSRDDLSFTMRDADGGLINWVMPDRAGNWHEHYGIGTIWFNEILELARHNAKEAYFAMRFAGSQMIRYWQQGHPEGFFDCMAQWALSGILSGSSEPHLPFSVSCPGIPPQEGMDYYLAQAAPRPSLSPEEQQRVDQQAMQEVLACQRQCYEYRRQQIMMRRT